MKFYNLFSWFLLLVITVEEVKGADDSYNTIHRDGSYEFGYNNPDSYHFADANRNNVVKGEFGGRNPGTGAFDSTVYTAGPRGFRPRGKNVARKYDLSQSGPRPVGSPDDPYYDPYEDPSYNFSFRTRTYNRQENANRAGDVSGKYSYIDDVGERHNVEFIAGKNTGFHVKTPFPDSNPRAYGPLYFNGRGKPIPRGRTSIQRGTDGSYKFVSAGPDQRRTETSDATGHVRGSYTYLDDKGVQHSVHYIAGPETGYRVLKNVKGPHLPTVFPFGRPEIIPPDFYDYDKDVFDTAAAGHIKPGGGRPGGGRPGAGRPGGAALGENIPGGDRPGEDSAGGSRPGGNRPGGGRPGGIKPGGGRPGGSRPGGGRPGGGRPGTSGPGGDLSGESKPGSKEDSKDKGQDEFTFGNKKPSSKPFDEAYSDDDTGDFDDLFEGGSTKPGGTGSSSGTGGSSGTPSTTARPFTPIPTSSQGSNKPGKDSEEDDGLYKPSGEEGSYKPIPTRPSFGNLPRPGGFGTTISTVRPTISGVRPSKKPTSSINVDYDGGYGAGKPELGEGEGDSNEVGDFGLFGSETGNARPPYGSRPVIHVGSTDDSCKKCAGTIVTNVGDKPFNVPPGVSVRAHVQAIDLLPISPSVPSPSEQYKFDTNMRTEQLNEASNQVVTSNVTENKTEKAITESTATTTLVPNT